MTGKTLTDSEDISARWKEYCEDIFSSNEPPIAGIESEDDDEQEPLLAEVEQAVEGLAKGKSSGCDNITSDEIKASGVACAKVYHLLVRKIWQTGMWPTDWKRAVFVTIPKKSDLQLCSNHRTIPLIIHASKILSKIILNRMKLKIETKISLTQAGFRLEEPHVTIYLT